MTKRTIVIPLHNEAGRLHKLFSDLTTWSFFAETEILFVDDGSRDRTVALVRAFAEKADRPNARLVELGSHQGKGAAVRKGMLAASGEQIVFTDADLPFGLGGVERVFAALDGGADVATGARDLLGSDITASPITRRVMSAVFRAWVKLVARTGDIVDTQCGLKGFNRRAAVRLFSDLRCRGLAFDIEIISKAVSRALVISKIPVTLRRSEGASSIGIPKTIAALFVTAPLAARHARQEGDRPCSDLIGSLAVPFLFFLLVIIPLWNNFHLDGGRDWDQFQADLLAARHAILIEKELPFWMPFRAGGHDAWADPQSMWFSPLGLLVVLFDFPVGARIFIALCVAMGAAGAFRLGKLLGFGHPGRLLMAAVLCLSSPAALYTAGGIPQFVLGLALLPWLVLLAAKATRTAILTGGLLLALDLYGGDVNHFIYHALFLFLFGVVYAFLKRSVKPLAAVVLLGVAAFIFSAPKFIPIALFADQNPRQVGSLGRGLTPRLFLHALLNKDAVKHLQYPKREFMILTRSGKLVPIDAAVRNEVFIPETFIDWVNGGAYVGGGTVILALGGLFLLLFLKWRQNRDSAPGPRSRNAAGLPAEPNIPLILALTCVSLVFLWLSLGHNVTPSAWNALQQLPVFSALRSPPRLILYVVFSLGILAALAIEKGRVSIARLAGKSRADIVLLLLVALIAADMYLASRLAYSLAFCEPPVHAAHRGAAFQQLFVPMPPGRTWYGPPVTPYVRSNKGLVNGYCAVPVARAALPSGAPGYRGEVFFEKRSQGTVSDYRITARRVTLTFKAPGASRLIVNQNWAPGWRALEPGSARVAKNADGRLAVFLPAGSHQVVLEFTSPGFTWGMLVLLIGLPALAGLSNRLWIWN